MAFFASCCGLWRKKPKQGQGSTDIGVSAQPQPNDAVVKEQPIKQQSITTVTALQHASRPHAIQESSVQQPVQQTVAPIPVVPSQRVDGFHWQRDWADWLINESKTLAERQARFNRRTVAPFVQITRDNACNFYGIDSEEMDQALPQRKFEHYGVHGSAFEHKAVRRLAYLKKAHLNGLHMQFFEEDQLYEKGRVLFNESHYAQVRDALEQNSILPPISIFYRNNNDDRNFRYQRIDTAYDTHAHDRYD